MDIHELHIHLDTSGVHDALDDVLDHVNEVNEALGIYASGALDCDCTELSAIEIGDIAQLNSGSPDLTVIDYCEDCYLIDVAWCDDAGGMQYATFPIECLTFED